MEIIRETKSFRLWQSKERLYIRCLSKHAAPRGRRVPMADKARLVALKSDTSFDNECVLVYGVGVFVK